MQDVDKHNQRVEMKTAAQHNAPIVGATHGTSALTQFEDGLEKAAVMWKPSSDEFKLNKTESAFWSELQSRPHVWAGCQNITLKLGDDCRYTPDFCVINTNGSITFFEVKGFWRDDAKVKIKVAARQFRWASFIVVQKTKLGWTETQVNP